MAVGGRATLAQPVIEIVVGNAQQLFELIEPGVVKLIDKLVREWPQDKVDLLHAPVPGTELDPLPARILGGVIKVTHRFRISRSASCGQIGLA